LRYNDWGSKGESSNSYYKILDELPFYINLVQGDQFTSGKQAFNETDVNLELQKLLLIRCAVSWEAASSTNKPSHLIPSASVNALSPPNQSLKLTENTACFSAARKTLFREMATCSARIVSGDLAVRRRSLAPVR
jgi:hypothetical protein